MGRVRDGDRAAAAGGVTTIVDMPLNSVPATTTVAALEAKRHAARGQCESTSASGAVSCPATRRELEPLRRRRRPRLQVLPVPSGVDEFPHVEERDLRQALPMLAAARPAAAGARGAAGAHRHAASRTARPGSYRDVARRSRPPRAEVDAIELLIRLWRGEFGAPRPHRPPVVGGGRRRARGAARAGGAADHRRDLPALPDVRRRGDSRRRDRVQMRAADSERGAIASALAWRCDRATSISSRPITRRRRRR